MANSDSYNPKKELRRAKAGLRLCNFLIGILCVVAVASLYIQPFFSVRVDYAVSAEQLQSILAQQMNVDVSEEDLEGVGLELGFSLTLDGKNLSGLLADELGALVSLGNEGVNANRTSDDSSSGTAEGNAALAARTGGDGEETLDASDGESSDVSACSVGGEASESNLWNALVQACKDNETVRSTISNAVDELLAQAWAAVPKAVAVYVKVVVSQQVNASLSGGQTGSPETPDASASDPDTSAADDTAGSGEEDVSAVASAMTASRPYANFLSSSAAENSGFAIPDGVTEMFAEVDIDELAALIEDILSKETVTVEEAQNAIMDYVRKNQELLGLTDEQVNNVEANVGEALNSMAQNFGEQATDENGDPVVDEDGNPVMVIRPAEVVTDLLVQAGILDESEAEDGAELSELLTDYILNQIGEAEDVLYIVFMAFSFVIGILYLLWGILLIKSIVKMFTGTPMGAFFVKLLTGLPFLLLVLVPTVGLAVLGGMEGVIGLLTSAGVGSEVTSQLAGLTLGVSGGWVAFACTVVLFVFGFFYSSFKRKYKNAKKNM